ncbi:MAG TPA: hypothetical protein VGV89_07265 [Thermoplasmata archaeon]|nr:hypothetical protein [Thermoplasmata archaeon]
MTARRPARRRGRAQLDARAAAAGLAVFMLLVAILAGQVPAYLAGIAVGAAITGAVWAVVDKRTRPAARKVSAARMAAAKKRPARKVTHDETTIRAQLRARADQVSDRIPPPGDENE